MNRSQYRTYRKWIRENGTTALKWIPMYERSLMKELNEHTIDLLAHRQSMLKDYGLRGLQADIRYKK